MSLGKTSTPEFGSPCYTEPEGRPPAVTPWDPDPDGRRLLGRGGGRGRGRAGAGGPGLRRRRLDPDPGVVLRAVRAQAHPGPDQRLPDVRRPDRSGDLRADRPDRARRGRDARRAGRSSGWRPVLGATSVRVRSSMRATGRPGALRIARFVDPVIADVASTPTACEACEDASRLLDVARPRRRGRRRAAARRGGAGVRDVLGGADRALGGAARTASTCCVR